MTDNENFWQQKVDSWARLIWMFFAELFEGIFKSKIPVFTYCGPGMFAALLLMFKIDVIASNLLGRPALKLPPRLGFFLTFLCLLSGFILWAGQRAFMRNTVLTTLKTAFFRAKLNFGNKFPDLIEDTAIDNFVRRLKIKNNGQPIDKWREAQETLASNLNINIVKLNYLEEDRNRIEIIYALKALAKTYNVPSEMTFADGEIPIGMSFEGPVKVNLHKLPHMLVAGETFSGKTNFMKLIARTLVDNNEEAEVYFFDYKYSAESVSLLSKYGGSHDRIFVFSDKEKNTEKLILLAKDVERRMQILSELGAINFEEYLEKGLNPKTKSDAGEAKRVEKLRRTYILIDEVAEVYSRSGTLSPEQTKQVREGLSVLARQARACGMHLVIGTQYPSAQGLDQSVKNNLPGILCFAQPSVAGSNAALGNRRAADLDSSLKGRAIWKVGANMEEVQTFIFE